MNKLDRLYFLSLSPKKCGKAINKLVDKKLKINNL